MKLVKTFFTVSIVLGLTACGDENKARTGKTDSLPVVDTPTITASSQIEKLGPEGLLVTSSPGWHAQQPPKYPEHVKIDFGASKQFNIIGLYPQSGFSDRNPKAFDFEGSMDGVTWSQILSVTDGCKIGQSGWIDFPLKHAVVAKHVRLIIKANCGSNYLTLMGIRFQ